MPAVGGAVDRYWVHAHCPVAGYAKADGRAQHVGRAFGRGERPQFLPVQARVGGRQEGLGGGLAADRAVGGPGVCRPGCSRLRNGTAQRARLKARRGAVRPRPPAVCRQRQFLCPGRASAFRLHEKGPGGARADGVDGLDVPGLRC